NTCFKIRLPLTLAIIDGMLVKVGDNIYIVPILSIVESVQPKKENIKQFKGKKEIIDLRGEYFSLIKLYNIFKIDNAIKDPTNATILIVETYRGKAAIMVDEVLDTQQIVIKKIGIKDKEVDKFSGATILGNGEVALILDLKNIHDSIYE
ncbi:MAG: chemotaxis protein CheA, partial [Fusobacteria bacterium]|nr:chemotaxis protein CheA [Fusobacteriota bacterium]